MRLYGARRRSVLCAVLVCAIVIGGSAPGQAQSQRAEIEILKQQLEDLRRREAERQKQIDDLQRQLERLESQPAPAQPAPVSAPPAPASPLDQAIQELPTPSPQPTTMTQPTLPGLLSLPLGRGAALRLIDVSADLVVGVGGSTEDNAELELLQGGDHDPRQNGFTLEQLELSLAGALDPYFTGETHIVFFIDAEGETRVELEEAFVTTQSLPFGLQVKAGFFLTEFGLLNPVHPHAWDWVDQPIILSRLFGGDGMRQAGLRVGWLTPLPWFSEFLVGVQNANGETMVSFLANDEVFAARPIGGRPFVEHDVDGPEDLVYLLRWDNSWNLSPAVTGRLGFSALFGPNSTGPDARTRIYGADFKVVWRPVRNFRGWPFLRWQTEFLWRNYEADAFTGIPGGEEADGGNGTLVRFPQQTLRDWGIYTQALYGFTYRWAAGLRFEYVTGSGASVDGRNADPFRDNRYRISPLLTWYASEFARIRLQYNYDRADHLANDAAHTVWLVFEGLYGAHPAHKF